MQYNYLGLPVEMQLEKAIMYGRQNFPTLLRIQQGEVSLILKTMIPDYFLSSGATQ